MLVKMVGKLEVCGIGRGIFTISTRNRGCFWNPGRFHESFRMIERKRGFSDLGKILLNSAVTSSFAVPFIPLSDRTIEPLIPKSKSLRVD